MMIKDLCVKKLRREIKNVDSFSKLCKVMGYFVTTKLKAFCIENNISFEHFKSFNQPRVKKASHYLGTKNFINSYLLKQKLISEHIKEHKCEVCERTEWNETPIPLELHHINGIRHDNRLENLQVVCPNCHALTENYKGKNCKKPKRTEKEYEQAVKNASSIRHACNLLALRPNGNNYDTIKNKMKKYDVQYLKPGSKMRRTADESNAKRLQQ